ncbi:MAG: hypothetical protein RHS_5918 [Robinsoniella sp. RHS]|uniref:DUF6906 family protein n=1 Tax=Robinsoniella sp. RHS TaxID=1504536 RepID=UPI000657D11C|nr:MAG: hypothetical protein RHS_5918 [Robinsoniella sp. RHS]
MKQYKRLTRIQKEILSKKHLNANNWMLKEETDGILVVVHKETGTRKIVRKERIPCTN